MDILTLLEQSGRISSDEAEPLKRQAGGVHSSPAALEDVLSKRGISLEDILKIKSAYYQMPARLAGDLHLSFEVMRLIPEENARHYGLIPLEVTDGSLSIGIVDPDNLEARDALNFIATRAGMPYTLYLISHTDFDRLILQYQGFAGEVGSALMQLEAETKSAEKKEQKDLELSKREKDIQASAEEDAPITKIVSNLVKQAVEQGASDIHIEPLVDHTRARFRVDGILQTALKLPPSAHASVVSRIKVLSNMRLDEKRKPQDGRFSARVGNDKVDFRVSTFPTYFGEKAVMRLLGMRGTNWTLDRLGMTESNLNLIRAAIRKPYGLILISGPTGSGKSTTLYSLLSEVDTEHRNVLSLEDPVEYTIPGVNQSQVRPEIGYTFANGLRTTLRQDPNVIMVGEIRDKETADLAVQAALTGHLVLSTIHTNNAIGIVPRLLDMDVDPYLIAPTLILGMAQRLVRTLCPGAGERVPVEGSIKRMIDEQFAAVPAEYRSQIPQFNELFRISSTPDCPSGTKGRTVVTEMYAMTAGLEHAILDNKPEDEILSVARKSGMFTMKEDALIKCAKGIVPLEEVNTLGAEIEIDEPVTGEGSDTPPVSAS